MSSTRKSVLCHLLTVVDGASEDILDLVEIKNFDLAAFRTQFDVSGETDPEMLERYGVGPDDAAFVSSALGYEVAFDFTRYAYFIEAAQKDVD